MLHKFEFDGSRIVLDVHSGTVHVVDELVWDLLEDFRQLPEESLVKKYSQKYDNKGIKEALAEIKDLEEKGQLFSGDPSRDLYSPRRRVCGQVAVPAPGPFLQPALQVLFFRGRGALAVTTS